MRYQFGELIHGGLIHYFRNFTVLCLYIVILFSTNSKKKNTRYLINKCYLVLKCHRYQTNEAGAAQDRSVPLYGIFQSVFLYSQEVAKNRQKEQRNCYKYLMYYSSLIFQNYFVYEIK